MSHNSPLQFISFSNMLQDGMVRVKKNDADIQNAFPKCVCGAARAANQKASSTNRKASSENRRFLPKKRKASSEECWICTHIGFLKRGAALLMDLPGLRLCLPSCIYNGKAEQKRKGFRKRASLLKTRTVCHCHSLHSHTHFWVNLPDYTI